jgi:hypothetical protein
MKNKFKILFFCMIFVSNFLIAQIHSPSNAKLLLLQLATAPVKPSQLLIKNTAENSKKIPSTFLSANFYASQLGFFCKQEIKMDKITKVPFRFRLGSVAECNRLEGKNR